MKDRPYEFVITDRDFFAYNMYYNLSQVIVEGFRCYIEEVEKRIENGLTVSIGYEFFDFNELKEEVEKIIEGFEILGNDDHPLKWTEEGDMKVDYALESFRKNFPTFWI